MNRGRRRERKQRRRKHSSIIGSTNHSKKSLDSMAVLHTTVLIGWNKLRLCPTGIQIGTTRKNCCSTVAIVSPKQSMQYQQEPPTSKSRTQCYATTQTYALCLNDQMLTKICTKNQIRLFKLTTPDIHHTSDLLTQSWTLMTHSQGCIAFTMHHRSMANLVTR